MTIRQNTESEVAEGTFGAYSAWFKDFRRDQLGTTAQVDPSAVTGEMGAFKQLIDLNKPDNEAIPFLISLRSEYGLLQVPVSQQPGQSIPVVDATNAAPIVITTSFPHGYRTGNGVTVQGVTGNTAANGSFTITITGPTTFQLDGSAGNGAFLAGGSVAALVGSSPNTNPIALLGGPLVGRVEWGVGGGFNAVEFDIGDPIIPPLLQPIGLPKSQPFNDIGNGVMLCVQGSAVRVYVRNDGNLAPMNSAGQAGVPNNRIGSVTPAKLIAFVGPGPSRGGPPLRRTIYAVCTPGGENPPTLLPADFVAITIPMFAVRVRIFRSSTLTPQASSLQILTRNNFGRTMRQVPLATNDERAIELFKSEREILVTNTGGFALNTLIASFDVDPI